MKKNLLFTNGYNEINADNYKLKLYNNPSKHDEKMCDVQHAVLEQSAELGIMIQANEPVADREDMIKIKRFYLLDITFNADDTVKSYGVNKKRLDTMLLAVVFFACRTIGVDFDPLHAMNNYCMRDGAGQVLRTVKGTSWTRPSQDIVRGRQEWQSDEVLRKEFSSTEAVLAEVRTIRCVEHTGMMKFITPFVGSQIDICKAFVFSIPDNCAPVYVSKSKSLTKRRGRPTKAITEDQEL